MGQAGSLTEQIYNKLHKEIVTRVIKPNEILAESKLAKRFEVSKTPVREALLQLGQEGWVEANPRVGYMVKDLKFSDIHEVFDLRLLLEGRAAYLAVKHTSRERVMEMKERRAVRRRELESGDANDYQYLKFHDDFHMQLAELSGNGRLKRFIAQLLNETTRLRMQDPMMSINDLQKEAAFEEETYKALINNQSERARKLLVEHIKESKQRIFEQIMNNG